MRYGGLIQGKYVLKVHQKGRAKTCENTLKLNIYGSYSPLHIKDAEAPTAKWYVHKQFHPHQIRWMASQHEHFTGVVRVSQPLPLDLNTFKYLATDHIVDKHLLISEWIELHDKEEHNKIVLKVGGTKAKPTPIRVRVSVEDDATLHFKLFKDGKFIKNAMNGFINELIENKGLYEIRMSHYTTQAKHKKLLHGFNSVQITIAITSQDFM